MWWSMNKIGLYNCPVCHKEVRMCWFDEVEQEKRVFDDYDDDYNEHYPYIECCGCDIVFMHDNPEGTNCSNLKLAWNKFADSCNNNHGTGHWLNTSDEHTVKRCSVCSESFRMNFDLRGNVYQHNFCPNCGSNNDTTFCDTSLKNEVTNNV